MFLTEKKMIKVNAFKAIGLAALIFSIFLILLIPKSAHANPMELEYSLGFAGIFPLENWAPLTVSLRNNQEDFKGQLEIEITSGSEYLRNLSRTIYSAEANIPSGSIKKYSFIVRINTFSHPLIIRLRAGDQVTNLASLNLRPFYTEKKLVLSVGGNTTTGYLSSLKDLARPVSVNPENLPEESYGYSGVKMVLIHSSAWEELKPAQVEALDSWVMSGGFLVAGSGLNYGSLARGAGHDLLGLKILGSKKVSGLIGLKNFSGHSLPESKSIFLVHARMKGAHILAEQDGIPLIMKKKKGLGDIIFLSFDFQSPLLHRWEGKNEFWQKIISYGQGFNKLPRLKAQGIKPEKTLLKDEKSIFNDSLQSFDVLTLLPAMTEGFPARFPSFPLIIFLITLYLILLYILFRLINKRTENIRKYIFYLLSIIAFFSIIAAANFFFRPLLNDPAHTSFASIIFDLDEQQGIKSVITGLATQKGGKFTFPDQKMIPARPILPGRMSDFVLESMTVYQNGKKRKIETVLDRWSSRFIQSEFLTDNTLKGGAAEDEQGLTLRLKNLTGEPIIFCQAYFRGRFFSFGDIPPDKKIIRTLPSDDIKGTPMFNPDDILAIASNMVSGATMNNFDLIRKSLTSQILLYLDSRTTGDDELVMFGWIDRSSRKAPSHNNAKSPERTTLLLWRMTVELNDG